MRGTQGLTRSVNVSLCTSCNFSLSFLSACFPSSASLALFLKGIFFLCSEVQCQPCTKVKADKS